MHEAEKQFLTNFVESVNDAANGDIVVMQMAVAVQNIKEVRVLVQGPSDSINRPIRLTMLNAGRTFFFEIDGRY